jgi:hypothetical protein
MVGAGRKPSGGRYRPPKPSPVTVPFLEFCTSVSAGQREALENDQDIVPVGKAEIIRNLSRSTATIADYSAVSRVPDVP